jgi:membrane associated rhomboid family serine protease
MLENRDYMRAQYDGDHWSGRVPMALWLVIVNVVFYAAQLIVPLAGASPGLPAPRLETHLALHPDDFVNGKVWQLFTFQVLHAGPLHLLINCAMLYIFGRPVEHTLGRGRFLTLYFGSGAVGGLLQVILSLLFESHFGYGRGLGWPSVLGASAGVFGLIAAFATLHRDTPITMLLAFIIPVSMKAKYLLLVELILAVLGMLEAHSNVAHAAHLGGMLGGIIYVRYVSQWNWRRLRVPPAARRFSPRELVNVAAAKTRGQRSSPDEPASTEEFISREVDPILDKISAHGIESLTERERQILEAARKKMERH